MTSRDRVMTALRRERPDRPPVALWRHFPEADGDARAQARAHLEFRDRHGLDLIKVTPASGYFGDDWGLRSDYRPNPEGVRTHRELPVRISGDWRRLAVVDVTAGAWGRELEALRRIRREAPPGIPVIETVFSPLSAARTLAGEEALLDHLRKDPAAVRAGLETIAETSRRFVAACLSAGADGIFFAAQMAREGAVSAEEYAEFGRPQDLRVLEAAAGAEIVVLHLHGEGAYFDLFLDYPAGLINWHDRRTPPDLAGGRRRFPGGVAGGIDESRIARRTPGEVAAEVRDALAATGGAGHLVAGGCVIPIDTPEENIKAAVEAARG